MRFGKEKRRLPTAGLSRRDQWRVILLILVVGGVIALVDSFRSVSSPEAAPPVPRNAPATQSVVEATDRAGELGVLTGEELRSFEDNTVLMSREEGATFFKAVRKLKSLRNATLARIAREDIAHSVLMADPELFRGQVIRLQGHIRRLIKRPVPSDVHDMDGLLEGWVFTPESDINPYRIVTLSVDDQIPMGKSYEPVPVELVGMFVRREAYASQSGTSVAPLLIAKKIRFREVAPPSTSDQLTPMLAGAICLAMSAILGAFLMTVRRQQRRRIEFRVATTHETGPVDIVSESPDEFLASLSVDGDSFEHRPELTSNTAPD